MIFFTIHQKIFIFFHSFTISLQKLGLFSGAPGISFIVSDANAGKIITKKQRQKRDLEWQQMKRDERARLREEMRKFSDILLVPNVDVYRNLPSQLLEFYRWYKTRTELSSFSSQSSSSFFSLAAHFKKLGNNFIFTGLQKICHFPSHSRRTMTVLWI